VLLHWMQLIYHLVPDQRVFDFFVPPTLPGITFGTLLYLDLLNGVLSWVCLNGIGPRFYLWQNSTQIISQTRQSNCSEAKPCRYNLCLGSAIPILVIGVCSSRVLLCISIRDLHLRPLLKSWSSGWTPPNVVR
jgi:hypothetical protein